MAPQGSCLVRAAAAARNEWDELTAFPFNSAKTPVEAGSKISIPADPGGPEGGVVSCSLPASDRSPPEGVKPLAGSTPKQLTPDVAPPLRTQTRHDQYHLPLHNRV